MIALTTTVLTWYQQKKMPRLFRKALEKQRPVSIHEVINANAYQKVVRGVDYYNHMGNTLNLLKLVRKRGGLTSAFIRGIGKPHVVTGSRILRGLNRAKSRK